MARTHTALRASTAVAQCDHGDGPPRDQLQGVLDLEADAVAASWTAVDDELGRWRAGFDEVFALVVVGSLRWSLGVGPGISAQVAVGPEAEELVVDHRAGRGPGSGWHATVAQLLSRGIPTLSTTTCAAMCWTISGTGQRGCRG